MDLSNTMVNFMHAVVRSREFKSLYRDEVRLRQALALSPFCTTIFDVYGVVMLHYLLHVDKLGFPRDYVRIKEQGMVPTGTLDIPLSIESGILFTGGIAWEKQELTRNTPICSLIKSMCLRYGRKAIFNIQEDIKARLGRVRGRVPSWRVTIQSKSETGEMVDVRYDFTINDAGEICESLLSELNVTEGSLADIKTLSDYDMDTMRLNLRTGVSNYTQGFKDLLNLIVRVRSLREKEKGVVESDYFKYFRTKNKDLFRDLEESEQIAGLRALLMIEDEACYVINSLLREKLFMGGYIQGRVFSPQSEHPLEATFAFVQAPTTQTTPDAVQRQIVSLIYPIDYLSYNHVGERSRDETFAEYLKLAGVREDMFLDMPGVLMCGSVQFITLSDEVSPPTRQSLNSGNGYVTSNLYMRDSAYYFESELKKLMMATVGF